MALGDPYILRADLKTRLGITDTNDDARLDDAIATATVGINGVCKRQFNKTTTASARYFEPVDGESLIVDDFHTTTGLVLKTDEDGDGIYETTWAAADRQLEPINGIVDGESGWPYWLIRAVDSYTFPITRRKFSAELTAQWGWTAVPSPVEEACFVVAEETFKLGDAPFGVAGSAEWGVMRVKANPMAMAMLAKYHGPRKILVA